MSIQSISSSLPPPGNFEASVMLREAGRVDASTTQEKAPPVQTVSQEQLQAAVKGVREYIEPFNSDLEFSINDETDQVVIKVVDKTTKEVIRQIPSEEMVAIAKALDSIKGLFIKQQA